MISDNNRVETIVSQLRKVSAKFADSIALEQAGASLSYGELNQRSDRLAAYLRRRMGVGRGDTIGICMDSGINMVLSLVASLKTGASYLPLDADLPKQRLQYILQEAQPKIVLTQRKYSVDMTVATQGAELPALVLLDVDDSWLQAGPELADSEQDPNPEDLAYIIYTSGSTGEPKGVLIEHRGLLNLARANVAAFPIDSSTRMIQFASLSFDAATWEIFSVLAGGGTLVLGSREDMTPGPALGAFLAHKRVSMICIAPSLLSVLHAVRADLSTLRTVVVAGEACPLSIVHDWVGPDRALWNAYGPTEATVCATMHRFTGAEQMVPIGRPLPGVSIVLLDEQLQPVPAGEPGEICIGGVGVARGYLKKPELTAAAFVQDPEGSGRLYRSGDFGVFELETGLLRFIGRRDSQVKVHGFRVELGAIESAMSSHPAILTAAVIATELGGYGMERSRSLVGYYVARPGADRSLLNHDALARFLDERLPTYMVPPVFVELAAMPMMPNRSKIDRSALPLPSSRLRSDVQATERAVQMAALFDQALGLPLGTFETGGHFFQMGGNSMSVAHLILAIKAEFGVRIPARTIYQHPTPTGLAAVVQALLLSPYREAAAEVVDVRAEARLAALDTPPGTREVQRGGGVLLTGASGFLGAFLLAELVRAPRTPEVPVHCLVHAGSQEQAQSKLAEQLARYGLDTTLPEGVQVWAGDIRKENLGLSAESYFALAESVSTVFHCGADVNHLKPYAALRPANVEGTRHALRFAQTCRTKQFNFASTLGVTGSADIFLGIHHIAEDFDLELSAPILDVENGYTKSKWVAERIVQEAAAQGLPVAIYRTGFLTGSTTSGVVNTTDLMSRLVLGCIQLGCYPNLPQKYWCPIPVDFVARAMVALDRRDQAGCFQLVLDRDKEPRHLDLFQMIHALGYPLRCVEAATWFDALAGCGKENALYPLVPFLLEKVHQGRNTILEVHYRSAVCSNQRMHQGLIGTGIEVPLFDSALMQRYLDYFIRCGLLAPRPA